MPRAAVIIRNSSKAFWFKKGLVLLSVLKLPQGQLVKRMLRESDEEAEEGNENFIGTSLDSTLSFLLGQDVDVMGDRANSFYSSTFSECTAATSSCISSMPTASSASPTDKSSILSYMPQPQQMKADYLLPHQWNSLTAVIRRGKLVKVRFR